MRQGEKDHPGVAIRSYTFFREGKTGANFVIRWADATQVGACFAMLTASFEALGYAVTDGGI